MRATLALNALKQFTPLLHLFYRAKQMTGFYISNATLGSNGLNLPFEIIQKSNKKRVLMHINALNAKVDIIVN